VPGAVPRLGNSVAWMDPLTGGVGGYLPIGSEPGEMALSDNGQFLYVALDAPITVRRVDLRSGAIDREFSIGSDQTTGSFLVDDMEVVPGKPESLAVARRNRNQSPRHEGVSIYDDGVQRPNSTPEHTGSNVIEFSGSASRLYGFNSEGENGFRRMVVDPSGVSILDTTADLISGFDVDIRYADGLLYTTTGRIIDPEAKTVLGHFSGIPDATPEAKTIDAPALVLPDPDAGRVFFLTGLGSTRKLLAFDRQMLGLVGSLPVPGVEGKASSLVRWGADGVAFRTSAGQLFLIRTPLVPAARVSVRLTPSAVVGGAAASGSVTLSSPAPAGGAQVALSSEDATIIGTPASVTVPAGATTVSFPITTAPLATSRTLLVQAVWQGATAGARLQVLAPVVADLTLNPNPVAPGGTTLAEVTLTGPAPAGGADVKITAYGPPLVTGVPESVTVPAGQASVTFPVAMREGPCGSADVTLEATYGLSRRALLKNLPTTGGPILSVQEVVGGHPVSAHVGTGCVVYEPLSFALSSDNPAVAAVPASVTLMPSTNRVTFTVTTRPVTTPTTVTLRSTLAGVVRTTTLRVLPAGVSSFSVDPSAVATGSPATGTITLTGPAAGSGFAIGLSTNQPAAVELPRNVIVPPGATTATFPISTGGVSEATLASVWASAGDVRTARLWVLPVGLSLTPDTVLAGNSTTATLVLDAPAAAGGAVVLLASGDPASVTVPAQVTVPASARLVTFPVHSITSAGPGAVPISATFGRKTWTATLTLLASPLSALSVDLTYLVGGKSAPCTVTLGSPAPAGGTVVELSSSDPAVSVPAQVTVPAGATSMTFTVSSRQITAAARVAITARAGVSRTVEFWVVPVGLSLFPTAVRQGETGMGLVAFFFPAGTERAPIFLKVISGSFVSIPDSLAVEPGATLFQFPIRVEPFGAPGPVVIRAVYGNQFWVATLTTLPQGG
jgi:hypothetical protein